MNYESTIFGRFVPLLMAYLGVLTRVWHCQCNICFFCATFSVSSTFEAGSGPMAASVRSVHLLVGASPNMSGNHFLNLNIKSVSKAKLHQWFIKAYYSVTFQVAKYIATINYRIIVHNNRTPFQQWSASFWHWFSTYQLMLPKDYVHLMYRTQWKLHLTHPSLEPK